MNNSLQRTGEIDDLRFCVAFGEKTFEVMASHNDQGVSLKFGDLDFLGDGLYTSTVERPIAELQLSTDWTLGQPIMLANIDGRNVTIQVQIMMREASTMQSLHKQTLSKFYIQVCL